MKRLVSLIPSGTEMVCALGCEDQLVGRSHECDYPPTIANIPVCTASTLPATGTSQAIDEAVQQRLKQSHPLYRVVSSTLEALRPDIILTQAQCHVCAVGESDVRQAIESNSAPAPELVTLRGKDLPGVWQDMLQVARALEIPDKGKEVIDRLRARIEAIEELACKSSTRPTVLSLEWMAPLMMAGHWMPELIELAGGKPAIKTTDNQSQTLTWDTIQREDSDVLLVHPCGFSLDRTRQDVRSLTDRPGWKSLRAVRNGQVFLADGHHFFNRPGPRLVESLEILAEILHPDMCHFGHEGRAWQKLEL